MCILDLVGSHVELVIMFLDHLSLECLTSLNTGNPEFLPLLLSCHVIKNLHSGLAKSKYCNEAPVTMLDTSGFQFL